MMIGLLLIAAALFIVGRNIHDDIRSDERAKSLIEGIYDEYFDKMELKEYNPTYANLDDIPDYVRYPDMEMKVAEINGQDCVGVLTIPAMEKEFPVMEVLNMYTLGWGPCKYSGTPYKDNFVIGAHNNSAHFGGLIRNVELGDEVTFVDMDGNVFKYTVEYIESLQPYESDKMINSEWDLSLFTCTWDLGSRYTVRCMRQNKQVSIVDLG